MIEFVIPGAPVAKQRPRFARVGAYVKTYSPAKTKAYEEIVAWHGKMAMGSRKPLAGALIVHFEFGLTIPASASKKRGAACLAEAHVSKPDITNLIKSVEDGLNGICWVDDSCIDEIWAWKFYSETPGVRVTIHHN